jgi:hypothetical protein
MAFKMKGHTLPGINQRSEGKNLSDGRAKSSAFQKEGAPFLGAVMGAVGKVKGVVDKVKKVKGTVDKVKDVASKIPGFKKHGDSEAEKSGAPAIWPFKKKVKTSGAVLDRERKKKARGKKIKTSDNKLRNAFNKTTKKISNKIQEPGKKGNRPGFD